jgi:hypothetical protein
MKSFNLRGPSLKIDPRVCAVRGDLADIRLATLVFAPHYAAPMTMILNRETPLLADAKANPAVVANLARGDVFEALDFANGLAWGTSPRHALVGYVARDALDRAPINSKDS